MRLDATGWIERLEIVELLATSGCLLGLIIGKSQFNSLSSKIIGLGYSLAIVPWQLSLAGPLEEEYKIRLAGVIQRLYVSITQFAGNQRLEDPIFFLACISILYWSFSLIAGYQLSRYGRPWYPLTAAGIVMVMIEFYHTEGATGLAGGAFVLCLLLLAGRLYYLKLRKGWDGKNLAIDAETGSGFGKGVLVMSLVIVLAAWNLPLLSPAVWEQIVAASPDTFTPESWKERLSKIVAALDQPSVPENSGFTRYMGLGRNAADGEDIIFSASIIENRAPQSRFYWRARTYDFYDNTSWVNTQNNSIEVPAGSQSSMHAERPGRLPATLSFSIETSRLLNLFTAGEPQNLNIPVEVIGEITPAGIEDVNAILPQEALEQGKSYRQTSLINASSISLLETAASDYPSWVKARYLQAPAGMTQRTKDLALQITAGRTTAYAKAEAITAYLRQNIAYENSVPEPPAGQDVLDWFLFDHKAGFCNYYASAEVILLRSVGVPARLAAGYAQGQQNPETGNFEVLRKDSHAWPEVYFAGVGWVEFEPTVSQPELIYPATQQDATEPDEGDINDREGLDRFGDGEGVIETPAPSAGEQPQASSPLANFWQTWKSLILSLVAALALAGLIYLLYRYCKKRKITLPGLIERLLSRFGWQSPKWLKFLDFYLVLPPISRSFAWVPFYIRLLGGRAPAGFTPAENMRLLNQIEPATSFYGNLLLREYEKETFSPRSADPEIGREAAGQLGRQVVNSWWQKLVRW